MRQGTHFAYRKSSGVPVSTRDRKRIRRLAIPPAWREVWICPDPSGHLQATGIDDRGRRQYLYHTEWKAVRDATKFHRLLEFSRILPSVRRRVRQDLRLAGLPREKVLAAVVRLLESTHIRIGNAEYARANESYGLSTLRNRHVKVTGALIRFRFRGKSGKFHEVEFSDQRLARIVERCQELPGHMLFEFVGDDRRIRGVTSGDINDYLREITGEEFTAKDFRTWAGTVAAASLLAKSDAGTADNRDGVQRVIDIVAQRLGNTRSVCRKYYIHPAVLEAHAQGNLESWFKRVSPRRGGHRLAELALIRFLKSIHKKNGSR